MCTTKSQISAQPCLLLLLFFLCTTTNVHCWQSALAPLARLKSKLRISPRTRNISRDRGSSGGGLFGQEASFPISSSSSSSSSRRNKGSSLYDSPTNGDKNHENGKERSNMGKRERIRHKVSNMWSNGRLKQSLSLDRNNGKAAAVEMATTPNKEELLEEMETENKLLRETIRQLEIENDRLHSQQRVVLESFEGDTFFFRSAEKEKQQQREYNFDGEGVGDQMMMDWGITLTEAEMSGDFKSIEDEEAAQWCDEVEDEACPVEPSISFGEALRDRAYWLVGLLAMQSCSGLILSRNEALLANHPIIIYFLTMLVGAGGK
mgnify:CR=1 FL=1